MVGDEDRGVGEFYCLRFLGPDVVKVGRLGASEIDNHTLNNLFPNIKGED